ncbi:hypothetical protein [Pseudalkalibacillus sp. SCS-8]
MSKRCCGIEFKEVPLEETSTLEKDEQLQYQDNTEEQNETCC